MDTVYSIWNQIIAQAQAHPHLVYFLVIGLVAGWLTGLLLGGGGFLRNLVVGVIGSFIGGFIVKTFNIHLPGGLPAYAEQLAVATIGAVLVVIIARVIAR